MKKISKIIFSLIIGIAFCVVPSMNVFANTSNSLLAQNETVGRQVTYDEILSIISDINDCSLEKAEEYLVVSQLKKTNNNTYSINQTSYQQALNNARSLSYWEDRTYVNSYNHSFPAKLFVYYSYTGSTAKRHIQEIIIVNVESENGSVKKFYDGTVSINLQGDQRYYYYVYGNLYNTGTTTSGYTVNIGINESLNIEFENSTSSNYYDYINRSGYIYGYR